MSHDETYRALRRNERRRTMWALIIGLPLAPVVFFLVFAIARAMTH